MTTTVYAYLNRLAEARRTGHMPVLDDPAPQITPLLGAGPGPWGMRCRRLGGCISSPQIGGRCVYCGKEEEE